jgi:hypothetical protein
MYVFQFIFVYVVYLLLLLYTYRCTVFYLYCVTHVDIPQIQQHWYVYISQMFCVQSFIYLASYILDLSVRKWCRLFQKRALSTKFDICVFIWITLFALISHYVVVLISVMSSVLDNLYFVALLSDLLFVASSVLVTELLA